MIDIGPDLVGMLIAEQFPKWAALPVRPVERSGWDNRTFRLGDEYVVRLPSAHAYAGQAVREWKWLPKLAPHLPVPISSPVAMGSPGCGYPFSWSIYRWRIGQDSASTADYDRTKLSIALAAFLSALQRIDTRGAPDPGAENFHRGGRLQVYDAQAREAIRQLGQTWRPTELLSVWEQGSATEWSGAPVWVHGDVAPGNLLVHDGELSAVIDFGQLCAGDPACDFAIAWSFFDKRERAVFHDTLRPVESAWLRGRCWALWKAAILVSGISKGSPFEMALAPKTLQRILDGP